MVKTREQNIRTDGGRRSKVVSEQKMEIEYECRIYGIYGIYGIQNIPF